MNRQNRAADESAEQGSLHVASTRFEAARELKAVPQINKFGTLHGHGFIVSALASVTADWAGYPGGEVPALLAEVERHAQMLNYHCLNDTLSEPSDLNLALWFGHQLRVPGLQRVVVQSTPDQGVAVDGDAAGGIGFSARSASVWRRYGFQAAHRLPNVPAGHKCGRMHGHGFEVVLYTEQSISVGTAVVDYDRLDRCWSPIATQLGYCCLNDIGGLENPTSEMLATWIWQQLKGVLPELSAVTVYETAWCGATFDGQEFRIWKDFTIDSAIRYRQAAPDDPRSALHGYTYTLRLNLSAPLDQVMGWTVDFGDVKAVFDPLFKVLDHHPLHENPELSASSDGDTASMARWILTKTQSLLPQIERVDFFEREGCGSSVGANLHTPTLPLVRVSGEGVRS